MGAAHACALISGGGLQCWGANGRGELGTGSAGPDALTPIPASAVTSPLAEVFAGDGVTCGITPAHTLLCWGSREFNQFGLSMGQGTSDYAVVQPIQPGAFASDISDLDLSMEAPSSWSCAVAAQDIQCYGRITGFSIEESRLPGAAIAIESGVAHACALDASATLSCWGWNRFGQLGDGTTTEQRAPKAVLTDVVSAAAGFEHTCAITRDAKLYCWGSNQMGAVGNGLSGSAAHTGSPTLVAGLAPRGAGHRRIGLDLCAGDGRRDLVLGRQPKGAAGPGRCGRIARAAKRTRPHPVRIRPPVGIATGFD